MARIRTIKPEMWDSEKLGRLSLLARLTFVGLISIADDEGRWRGSVPYLRGRLHAYAKDVSEQDMQKALTELDRAGVARFYTVGDCTYYHLPGFKGEQYIEKPRPSTMPPADADTLPLLPVSPALPLLVGEASPNGRGGVGHGVEGKGLEGKGSGGEGIGRAAARFTAPSVEEVRAYCVERKNSVDPQKFVDHYEARGWKPKGYTQVMKDWRAAVRTWEKNEHGNGGQTGASRGGGGGGVGGARPVGAAAPRAGKYAD